MIDHAKKALPLVGGSLLLALALSGCDRQADQTVPPAANSVAATPVLTDSGNNSGIDPITVLKFSRWLKVKTYAIRIDVVGDDIFQEAVGVPYAYLIKIK